MILWYIIMLFYNILLYYNIMLYNIIDLFVPNIIIINLSDNRDFRFKLKRVFKRETLAIYLFNADDNESFWWKFK